MARPQCDTPLIIYKLLSFHWNIWTWKQQIPTILFCFLICFVYPTPNTFETADLISSDLHERERERERERDPFMVKLRSWGNLIQEQPQARNKALYIMRYTWGYSYYQSNHIMILWKEFPHYTTHNNYIWHPRCQIHYHISLGHMPIMHKYMLV
jgi:hypothetical protein